ncbi:CBS domain containing-hemolysin-like protein [Granulicella aggregans]|uniref:CBS domain containing-hemolysin-like protein n=1 Tax=Granulicella aggregans TaxID=474949 RepID=A0A7W7ZB92_9BACT|nr:hemolysin family protein [Granulicella aggregans]MBB5056186.1 CBS domain containing-hemolysin-like protein [Granulicella aggregans]
MNAAYFLSLVILLGVLLLAAYVDRVYSEMGKFLAREYQDNIDAWEEVVEPRLHLARESIALSASVLRQLSLAAMAMLSGLRLYSPNSLVPVYTRTPHLADIARTIIELVLLIVIFDRLLPQLLFTRTRGLWIAKIRYLLEALFYLVLPVTLLMGLLLSIAALAEPEDTTEEDHPSEAMDALLEAGEEEGILEESDRELVRSVVEFGDKVVREVMTPRPEIYAVEGSMTLEVFTASLEENIYSRVPVFSGQLDNITGIVFAHDLLQVLDTEAGQLTVSQLQKPAAFVPETKKVNELLREMQREKQHMRIVIDEYGGVAGLITIEDLIEAIVGNISDEHDETEDDDAPVAEPDGSFIVSGSFEISRLRDLFQPQFDARFADREDPSDTAIAPESSDASAIEARTNADRRSAALPLAYSDRRSGERRAVVSTTVHAETDSDSDSEDPNAREEVITRELARDSDQPTALRLPEHYESTTLGGLVSEIAGHIPLRGEVVEEDGLRLEVLASTDRRIDRIRVALSNPSAQE